MHLENAQGAPATTRKSVARFATLCLGSITKSSTSEPAAAFVCTNANVANEHGSISLSDPAPVLEQSFRPGIFTDAQVLFQHPRLARQS
jgi:hypothetical protein